MELTWFYDNITLWKVLLILGILFAGILGILKLFKIRSLTNRRGVRRNVDVIRAMQSRDRNIITANRMLRIFSSVAKIKLFSYDSITRDYMNYNLKRAGIKAPGGFKDLKADEFRGAIISSIFVLDLLTILLMPLITVRIAIVALVGITLLGWNVPSILVRSMVVQKDSVLKEGFPDFYLMMHYILLTGGKTPLARVMRSYSRTTDNEEIIRFIDISIDYIETYGEYPAMTYIARDYREIPEVGRFCRLVKQLNEGGDIENDLIGFRSELIQQKKWMIEARGDKIIAKAKASFNILFVVLVQAVISAMLIYLPDLQSAGGLFKL